MELSVARGIAAQAWSEDETRNHVMDPVLAEAFAKRIMSLVAWYEDALIWTSGCEDFQQGGKARVGYEKLVQPLIHPPEDGGPVMLPFKQDSERLTS